MEMIKATYFNDLTAGLKKNGIDEQTAMREFYFAAKAINGSKQLSETSRASRFDAVFNAITCGLTLNPNLKFGYLIPRWNRYKNEYECQFEPSYQGLAYLAVSDGITDHIVCQNVCENDEFKINLATGDVEHYPAMTGRGDIIGTYALATDQNGNKTVEWIDRNELDVIRGFSESYQSVQSGRLKTCAWIEWHGEMCRKTTIKRLFKYLSKNDESRLADAIEIDNEQYKATLNQIMLIESLLQTANIDPETRDFDNLNDLSFNDAQQLIQILKENQTHPIHDRGGAASMRDVNDAVMDAVNDPRK